MRIEFKHSQMLDTLSSQITGETLKLCNSKEFIKKLEKNWKNIATKTDSLIKSLTNIDLGTLEVYVSATLPSYASIDPPILKISEKIPEAIDSLIYILTVRAMRMNRDLTDKLKLMSIASGFSTSIFEKCISMYVRFKILKEFYGENEMLRIKHLISKRSSSDRIAVSIYDAAMQKISKDSPRDFMKSIVSVLVEEKRL